MPRQKSSSSSRPAGEDQIRGVLDSIRRVVRVLRVSSRDSEKRLGLSSAQLFVLQKLAEARVLSVNEVAGATHTHQSSVSVVVQRLVNRGLVARQRSEKDARQMELTVTPAGRAQLHSAPAAAQDQIIDALSKMPGGELVQLGKSLQSLVDLLGVSREEPAAMLFEDDADFARRKTPRASATREDKVPGNAQSRKRR